MGHAVYGCRNSCMCIVRVWGGMCKPLRGGWSVCCRGMRVGANGEEMVLT